MDDQKKKNLHTRATHQSLSLSLCLTATVVAFAAAAAIDAPPGSLYAHTTAGDLRSKIMSTLINKLSQQTTEKKFSLWGPAMLLFQHCRL